jgi:hypothetical protein
MSTRSVPVLIACRLFYLVRRQCVPARRVPVPEALLRQARPGGLCAPDDARGHQTGKFSACCVCVVLGGLCQNHSSELLPRVVHRPIVFRCLQQLRASRCNFLLLSAYVSRLRITAYQPAQLLRALKHSAHTFKTLPLCVGRLPHRPKEEDGGTSAVAARRNHQVGRNGGKQRRSLCCVSVPCTRCCRIPSQLQRLFELDLNKRARRVLPHVW